MYILTRYVAFNQCAGFSFPFSSSHWPGHSEFLTAWRGYRSKLAMPGLLHFQFALEKKTPYLLLLLSEKGHEPMSCVAIIDDSVVVRKIVETSMSRVGIHCLSFRDGYEALRVLQTHLSQPPDLIFLDINLPLIDGFDLLRLLRSHADFDRVVIVMLSSRDSVLDRVKCRLAGARAYLVKPFRTQDLLAVVALYLPAFSAGTSPQAAPRYPEEKIHF